MLGVTRRTMYGLALCPLLAESAFAQSTSVEAPAVDLTSAANGQLTVAVTIGGAGPYAFIVDTGAERSVIARELATELNLTPTRRSGLISLTRTQQTQRVAAPRLSFAPGQSIDLEAFVLDGANIGAAGILGINALQEQRVLLDFDAARLSVSPAQRHEAPEPDAIVVHARPRLGQLILANSHLGDTPVDVIVDTGSNVSVGNAALERALPKGRRPTQPIVVSSVTGETLNANYTFADRLVIGRVELRHVPVAFTNAYFFTHMRLTRRPALLLGTDVLRMFARVSVDFVNRNAAFVFRPT